MKLRVIALLVAVLVACTSAKSVKKPLNKLALRKALQSQLDSNKEETKGETAKTLAAKLAKYNWGYSQDWAFLCIMWPNDCDLGCCKNQAVGASNAQLDSKKEETKDETAKTVAGKLAKYNWGYSQDWAFLCIMWPNDCDLGCCKNQAVGASNALMTRFGNDDQAYGAALNGDHGSGGSVEVFCLLNPQECAGSGSGSGKLAADAAPVARFGNDDDTFEENLNAENDGYDPEVAVFCAENPKACMKLGKVARFGNDDDTFEENLNVENDGYDPEVAVFCAENPNACMKLGKDAGLKEARLLQNQMGSRPWYCFLVPMKPECQDKAATNRGGCIVADCTPWG